MSCGLTAAELHAMVDACAAAAGATPVAEPAADPISDHNTHPSTPVRAAATPSAAKGGDAQAKAAAPAPAPDDPNPTEAELAEARQRRKWREEHLGQDPDDETLGAARGAPEVDTDGYYEESRWYEFAVDDLAAADGAELELSDDDGEDDDGEGDDEVVAAGDMALGAGGAGSSRPGVYRYAESELSAGTDAAGVRGTAQAHANGGAPAGGAGARAAGAAAAATRAAPEVGGAAAPAAGAPTPAVAASGEAAGARPAPSSPFVVPKLASGSPAQRAAAAGARGGGATAAPGPAPVPGKAGPTSPLPLPFGGRVGARLQQMGVRAGGAGAAAPTGSGPPAIASTPQATSAHRPKGTALAGLASGPGNPVPYVRGAAPPEAQVAATALADGRPVPQGGEAGASGEAAAGTAAAAIGEQARSLTFAELRDVAQRRGLSFEALVAGARKRGVEIQGD